MLKLLLNKNREQIKGEYVLRFANIQMIFLIVIILATGVFLAAPYMLANVESRIIKDELEAIYNSDTSKQREGVDSLRKKVNDEFLLFNENVFSPTELLAPILQNQVSEISLNGINFEKRQIEIPEGEDPLQYKDMMRIGIELRGVAGNRDALVEYQKKLQKVSDFKSVDIPLTDLTQGADFPFTVFILAEIFFGEESGNKNTN